MKKEAKRKIRVGKNQMNVLKCLREHGTFGPMAKWYWGNRGTTVLAMMSLEKKKLAERFLSEAGTPHWRITKMGLEVLESR